MGKWWFSFCDCYCLRAPVICFFIVSISLGYLNWWLYANHLWKSAFLNPTWIQPESQSNLFVNWSIDCTVIKFTWEKLICRTKSTNLELRFVYYRNLTSKSRKLFLMWTQASLCYLKSNFFYGFTFFFSVCLSLSCLKSIYGLVSSSLGLFYFFLFSS